MSEAAATPAAPAATTTGTPAPAAPAPAPEVPAPEPGTPTPAPAATPAAPPPPPAVEAKKDEPPAPRAPEKYEFVLPEGVQMDAKAVESFTPLFKELDLPQEAAQKLVTAQVALAQAQANEWRQQSLADKEFGGDKFDENLAVATRALEKFGSPELNAYLKRTGLGSHPELIRAFFRAGKAISEDGFVAGRAGTPGGDSIAQRMFPNMNP